MAILAVKQNIPCNDNNCEHNWYYEDLHNAKGFKRVRQCPQNHLWNPYMMVDKHRPSKLGIEGNSIPWATNNFTERIRRTIESNYSGKQTVLSFLERLYGIKLSRDNLTENSGQNNFEARLVTLFNVQSIEQHSKNSDIFILPYDDQIVEFTEETMKNLSPMIKKPILEAGNLIFNHVERSISNHMNDPFRPDGLNNHASSNYGAPSKPSAKPRKRNPLQVQLSNIPSNPLSNDSNLLLSSPPLPFSVQKRQTKRIRQNSRKNNVLNRKQLIILLIYISVIILNLLSYYLLEFYNKGNIQTSSSSSIFNNIQFILPSPKKAKLTEYTKYDLMNLMN
ncbi:hypothetical protein GLOIN_2v1796283 [Rhizophagus clarus]|uniref:Uncharacterized protein n=1 Tax=Rhizophagus clarus TaxID=94130 RepID=A0A8H3KV31_9GLOM|nr:hypothetical protein GLOIN_2v1796283 [Rhizophagus clarus]